MLLESPSPLHALLDLARTVHTCCKFIKSPESIPYMVLANPIHVRQLALIAHVQIILEHTLDYMCKLYWTTRWITCANYIGLHVGPHVQTILDHTFHKRRWACSKFYAQHFVAKTEASQRNVLLLCFEQHWLNSTGPYTMLHKTLWMLHWTL